MPEEINEQDIYYPRSDTIWFLGSLSNDGKYANISLIKEFGEECEKNGLVILSIYIYYNANLTSVHNK